MTQAVVMAEQYSIGEAACAEYENSKNGWIYDVEVVSGPTAFNVKVNADKSTIIYSAENRADRDDDRDEKN